MNDSSASIDDLSDEASVSSLKSNDYDIIDKILNEKEPSETEKKPDQPWWLNPSADQKSTLTRRSNWLKQKATKSPTKESSLRPPKDEKSTHDVATDISVKPASVNKDLQSNASSDSISTEISTKMEKSSSSQIGSYLDEYSESFEENDTISKEIKEIPIDTETKPGAVEPEVTTSKIELGDHNDQLPKVKRVTFSNRDDVLEPSSVSSLSSRTSTDTSNKKSDRANNQSSRIAATFSGFDDHLSSPIPQISQPSSISNEEATTLNEEIESLKERLAIQESTFNEVLESERKNHLEEITELQNQVQLISDQVLNQRENNELVELRRENDETKSILSTYEAENKRLASSAKQTDEDGRQKIQSFEKQKQSLAQENALLKEQLERNQAEKKFLKEQHKDLEIQLEVSKAAKSIFEKDLQQDHLNELQNQLKNLREENNRLKGIAEPKVNTNESITILLNEVKNLKQQLKDRKQTRTLNQTLQRSVSSKQIETLDIHIERLQRLLNMHMTPKQCQEITPKHNDHVYMLEDQICDLQMQLESKDLELDSRIRTLKEEYNSMKHHYEHHRNILQQHVDKLKNKSGSSPKKSRSLENSPSRVTVTSLLRECEAKEKEIQSLKNKLNAVENQGNVGIKSKVVAQISKVNREAAIVNKKDNVVMQKVLDGIRLENNKLSEKVEKLEELRHNMTIKFESEKLSMQSELYDRIRQLENEQKLKEEGHNLKIRDLKAEFASRHSSSKLAKVLTQVETQQLTLEHYKKVIEKYGGLKDKLSEASAAKKSLQTKVIRLQEDLDKARASQSPKMRHFEELRLRIHEVEERYAEKEREMKRILSGTSVKSSHSDVVDTWKQRYYEKHRQIFHFKAELDEILSVMDELKNQGIILPKSKFKTSHTLPS